MVWKLTLMDELFPEKTPFGSFRNSVRNRRRPWPGSVVAGACSSRILFACVVFSPPGQDTQQQFGGNCRRKSFIYYCSLSVSISLSHGKTHTNKWVLIRAERSGLLPDGFGCWLVRGRGQRSSLQQTPHPTGELLLTNRWGDLRLLFWIWVQQGVGRHRVGVCVVLTSAMNNKGSSSSDGFVVLMVLMEQREIECTFKFFM